jgi:cation/acetate symporter
MIIGISFTAYYIIACLFFKMEPWTFGIFQKGINPQGIGVVGMLMNFALTLILAPFFQAAGKKAQDMVDSVREPEGVGPAIEIEAAPEH